MTLYRLEFNQNQQVFHLAEKSDIKRPGWYVISESCTPLECIVLQCYCESKKTPHMTNVFVLKCLSELKTFWSKLMDEGITFEFQ